MKKDIITRQEAKDVFFFTFNQLFHMTFSGYSLEKDLTGEQLKLLQLSQELNVLTGSDDYDYILDALSMEGFSEYYELVKTFANTMKLAAAEDLSISQLAKPKTFTADILREKKTKDLSNLINDFHPLELQSVSYTEKMTAIERILDGGRVQDEKENALLTVLESFQEKEFPLVQSALLEGENSLLKKLLSKINGVEKNEAFFLFDRILNKKASTKDSVFVPSGRTVSASFKKDKIKLTIKIQMPGMSSIKENEYLVSPFAMVEYEYKKERFKIPAFFFTDASALDTFIFENRYTETLDFSKVSEEEKEKYYFEFIMHYLPQGFLEQLGSPLQLIIGAIAGILLAGLLAPLKALLIALDIGSIAFDAYQGILLVIEATEKRKNAGSMRELKESAKIMASGVSKLTMQVVNAILSFAPSTKKGGGIPDSTSSKTPGSSRSLLESAGYKSGTVLDSTDTLARVDTLRSTYGDDELKQLFAKGRDQKKGIGTILEKFEKDITYQRLFSLKNSDAVLKKYDTFFGADLTFQNELVTKCTDPDILSNPKKLLKNYGDTFSDYYSYSTNIMKRTDITLERRIIYLQEYYKSLPTGDKRRIDALVPKGIEFFNPDGTINWPKFMGFDVGSLKGLDDLPKSWYRTGSPRYGSTYTDASHTNFELSLPHIDNPDAVHSGIIPAENTKYYKDLIDAIAANDEDAFKKCFRGDDVDAKATFIQARNEYNSYIKDVQKYFTSNNAEMTISTDSEMIHINISNRKKQVDILYKYGISGIVAEWRSVKGDIIGSGGPNQYSLPFSIDTLKDMCLTK